MSTDIGDVLALCTAHKLQDLGHAEIAAVVHDTGLDSGVAAIATLNSYYGREHIPLGAYKGQFLDPDREQASRWVKSYAYGPYVGELSQTYPAGVKGRSQVPDATEVYRKALAESRDASVVIASIGFLGNLAALLDSPADQHSPLAGKELVASKVRELVVMGGRYPSSQVMHYQWNFGGGCEWGSEKCPYTPAWTKKVVDGWPSTVPITFSGYELGLGVLTGSKLASCATPRNPCRAAMEFYSQVDRKAPPSPSWDPVTIFYAVLGLQRWGERHRGGLNSINGTDGANAWVDGGLTHHSYLTLLPGKQEALANEIDDLLCLAPALVV